MNAADRNTTKNGSDIYLSTDDGKLHNADSASFRRAAERAREQWQRTQRRFGLIGTESIFFVLKALARVWSYLLIGYIAQWLERLTADQQVPGSNPGVPFRLRLVSSGRIKPRSRLHHHRRINSHLSVIRDAIIVTISAEEQAACRQCARSTSHFQFPTLRG